MTQARNINNTNRTGLLLATLLALGQVSHAKLTLAPNQVSGAALAASVEAKTVARATGGGVRLQTAQPGQRDSSPECLDILRARGFIGELYTIESRDKTPLSVYHIINPFANQRTLNRYPVLVFHGVAADAAQMVAHSERMRARPPVPGRIVVAPDDTSLALLLSNNNFDVYLVDARGTNLNNHLAAHDLDPVEGQKFWNFSLDEQIHYDLPAVIDFILAQTRADKLHYIGFSESTFFMFALMTRLTEYQNKLASFVALAPVAYVGHITGLALSLFTMAGLVPDSINANFMPQPISDTVGVGVRRVCNNPIMLKTVCSVFATGVAGMGDDEQSRDFYSTLMKSTSIKAVKHFLQLYQQKRFGMYDYGPVVNMRTYGAPRAPNYDLSKIKLPTIVLFRGATDFLSNPTDQQLLLAHLGTKPYRDFNYPHYNHIDFLSGRTVVADINAPAASVMFDLLKINAANSGQNTNIFVDPIVAGLPKPYKPLAVIHPDGSHTIKYKSNFMNNLMSAVMVSNEAQRNAIGLPPRSALMSPMAQQLFKQNWDLWQSVDDKVQSLGSGSVPNLAQLQLPALAAGFG